MAFEKRNIMIEADILFESIHRKKLGVCMPMEGKGSLPITIHTMTAIFVKPIIWKDRYT
jgi:hypothetical protein